MLAIEARHLVNICHKKISYISVFLFLIFDVSFIICGAITSSFDIWFIFTSWFLIVFFALQILYILLSPLIYIITMIIMSLVKK